MENQDMRNAAYTLEYLNRKEELENLLFKESNHTDETDIAVSQDIILHRKSYATTQSESCPYNLCGSENTIILKGKNVYTFRSVDDSGNFCKLISHSNGNHYLIFRRDLYGYSILEIETLKDFHYFPVCQLIPNEETFIWVDVLYNPKNNLMVVNGCYWACPYDLALIDFANPFQPAENQVCILLGKKDIGTVNSYCWQDDALVIHSKHRKWIAGRKPQKGQGCDGYYIDKYTIKTYKTHRMPEALCREWLAEGNYVQRKIDNDEVL